MASAAASRSRWGTFARRRRIAGLLFTLPALAFVAVFFFLPLGQMIWMSLNKWPLLGDIHFQGLSNYIDLFSDSSFLSALLISAVFVLIATPLTVLVGLGLALLIKDNRPAVNIFRSIYFMPLVIGFATAAYIWLWLLNPDVGIVDKIL